MLSLRGFGWRHAGRRAWALRGVDLDITAGERILLLGPSGAGKSTLLRAVAGLLPADSGEAQGRIERPDGRAGIVFQDPQSQLVMSRAGDEVAFGLENLGWPADRIWPRVDAVLHDVGFRYPRDRSTNALSGGEQQRLVLAGALATEPGLLLLDEPTANLDPLGSALVRQTLRTIPAETTTILIEHRIAEVLDQVTRVIVLAPGGGIRADGPPSLLHGPLGAELATAGVWVPGHDLPIRKARAAPGGWLLQTSNLGVRRSAAFKTMAFPDLEVQQGETVVITGANGSGKSTLALALGGLIRAERGAARTPWGCPQRWRARTLAQHVGSVFQNPEHQFATASVRAELALGGTGPDRVEELLSRLRLEHLADANPFTLSGGEARRLSVATALAAAPQILIFDEPTFGQDRRTWIELVELIAQLRDDGRAVVAVTHDPDVVRSLADRTVELATR